MKQAQASARQPGQGELQPVFALYQTALLPSLEAFLTDGGRKIDAWYGQHAVAAVDFADEAQFANVNTLEELKTLQ